MTALPVSAGLAAARFRNRPPTWATVPRIEGDEAATLTPKSWRIYRIGSIWTGEEWETSTMHALRGIWTDEAAVRARVKELNEGKR